jgi:hypothetical protein
VRRALILAAVFSAVGCASTPSGDIVPAQAKVPYVSPAPSPHNLEIRVDSRAAREILAALSRPAYDSAAAAALQALPAVRLAIQDASRNAEIFERDFAAAFGEEAKAAVFDFRGVRADRERWTKLLETISSGEADLVRRAAESAATLLPDDRPISLQLQVLLSFGLAGLADHVLVPATEGRYVMIVDLARALGDSTSEPPENQRSRLSRLIAGGAHRQAWSVYREASPAWQKPDPRLGQIEPLLRVVAEAGPVALFSVDENFFPLSVWLKEPMKRNIGELNRMAELLSDPETDLDHRMNMTAEIRRPDFSRRLGGPAGAFLSDVIIQAEGMPAFRKALAAGPRAFFAAYDRAAESQRDLVELSRVIQERVRDTPPR